MCRTKGQGNEYFSLKIESLTPWQYIDQPIPGLRGLRKCRHYLFGQEKERIPTRGSSITVGDLQDDRPWITKPSVNHLNRSGNVGERTVGHNQQGERDLTVYFSLEGDFPLHGEANISWEIHHLVPFSAIGVSDENVPYMALRRGLDRTRCCKKEVLASTKIPPKK